jgi:hypothetical protein
MRITRSSISMADVAVEQHDESGGVVVRGDRVADERYLEAPAAGG